MDYRDGGIQQPLLEEDETNSSPIFNYGTNNNGRIKTLNKGTKTLSVVATQLSQKSQPVTLAWNNLQVYGTLQSTKRDCCGRKKEGRTGPIHILKDVSGIINPGELVALMGASGAGKTTLINTLTGRNVNGLDVSGSITCNGQDIGRAITAVSAYVQQDDLFIGTLTVREHLIFQALLRLPKVMSLKEKIHRAEEVLYDLGLYKCKDTKIGMAGVFKGISGGEAKRLAFASEILTNPAILFCDEPTTGLDSFMAENIVHVLQKLARKGKTVLCTIHQPASEVYLMFNRVYFMGEGRTAFFGNTNEGLKFFSDCGFPCPLDFNPADFLIQTLAIVPGLETECRNKVKEICDKYEKTAFFASTMAGIEEKKRSLDSINFNESETFQQSPYKNGWMLQFLVLMWRGILSNYRNRNVAMSKILQKSVLAIFVGLVYTSTKINQEGVMNYSGALFFIATEFTFPAIFGILTVVPTDFQVVVREHHNGMYKIGAYYVGRIISFIPVYTIDGILFMCIAYFLVGFRSGAGAFLMCMFISVLIAQVAAAFGTMLSCVSPNFPIALSLTGPLMVLVQLTGGFLTNINSIPVFIRWFQWVSWFRYGFEALLINQWHLIKNIECDTPNLACVNSGDEVLENFGFQASNLGFDIGLLFVLMLGYYMIGYLALWLRVYRAR